MRFSTPRTLLVAVSLSLHLLNACKKPNVPVFPPPEPQSIFRTLQTAGGYSFLTEGIKRAGLQDSLDQGAGPYTLFAASDADFKQSYGFRSLSDFQKLSDDSVTAIVKYHLFGTRILPTDIPSDLNSPSNSLGGLPVYFTHGRRDDGSEYFYANGTPFSSRLLLARNGFVYPLEGVLNPPLGTLIDLINSRPDLSILRAIEAKVHKIAPIPCPYCGVPSIRSFEETLFAPNDQAFASAGYRSVDDVNHASFSDLYKLLSYHLVAYRNYSFNYLNGQNIQTLNGQSVQINFSSPQTSTSQPVMTVKGTGDSDASTVLVRNRVSSNGILHIIDKVLTSKY